MLHPNPTHDLAFLDISCIHVIACPGPSSSRACFQAGKAASLPSVQTQQRSRIMGKPKNKVAADDVDKKRKQNRIAQQGSRERQNAYIRNLEALVDAVTVKSNEAEDSKYSRLLKVHLQLMEEKKELEDTLLRLRQKLLSIGNMAVTVAGK